MLSLLLAWERTTSHLTDGENAGKVQQKRTNITTDEVLTCARALHQNSSTINIDNAIKVLEDYFVAKGYVDNTFLETFRNAPSSQPKRNGKDWKSGLSQLENQVKNRIEKARTLEQEQTKVVEEVQRPQLLALREQVRVVHRMGGYKTVSARRRARKARQIERSNSQKQIRPYVQPLIDSLSVSIREIDFPNSGSLSQL